MSVISMKELLEAGVHFGHQTRRWNPKMKPYIFGARNGIHIIDLQKTVRLFKTAYDFISRTAADGYSVLYVGTKKQAHDSIIEESERCGMFYMVNRWLGGTLTNFQTIRKSIARLKELEAMNGTPCDTSHLRNYAGERHPVHHLLLAIVSRTHKPSPCSGLPGIADTSDSAALGQRFFSAHSAS